MMSGLEFVGEAFRLANTLIEKYVDDPARRARARREYVERLERLRRKISKESDYEKMDALLLELIAALRNK